MNYIFFAIVKQSTFNTTLSAKLNVCQFAMHSNLLNLMFTKHDTYTVHVCVYISNDDKDQGNPGRS